MSCKSVVFGLVLGLGLAMSAWADDGFIGQWTIKQEFQGQERISTLTIVEDGGTWESRRGVSELSKVKIVDGKLTFTRTFNRQGQEFSIDCEATIVDGKLVGKMVTPRGEREFIAIRIAAIPSFIGKWDIEMEFQGRPVQATLEITEAEGGLVGKWSSGFGGDTELDDVAITDNTLTFSRTINRQGREFTTKYTATLVDGKLSGQMVSRRGDTPFTGTAFVQPVFEHIDPPDVVLKAVENWGALSSHVREAIEGLAAGELKE